MCVINNSGINVGGTAEVFSSLNLELGDFVIFADSRVWMIFEGPGRIARTELNQIINKGD